MSARGAVFIGGEAGGVFEGPGEILRVLIAERVGNLAYGLPRLEEEGLGSVDDFGLDVVFGCASGLFFMRSPK